MLLLWLQQTPAASSACPSPEALQKAKALYKQAQAAQDQVQAVSLLRESIAACETFQNYTLLAYSLLQLQRYNEALEAGGGERCNKPPVRAPKYVLGGCWRGRIGDSKIWDKLLLSLKQRMTLLNLGKHHPIGLSTIIFVLRMSLTAMVLYRQRSLVIV